MATKKSSTPAKRKSSKKVPIVPTDGRLFHWIAATIAVGGLGLIWTIVLQYFVSQSDQYISTRAEWFSFIALGIVSLYIIFLLGFVMLGKFRLWRTILPVVSLLIALVGFSWPHATLFGQWLVQMYSAEVVANTWTSPAAFIYFAAYFLVVASGFTLLQAILKRQKHSRPTILAISGVFLISIFLILL